MVMSIVYMRLKQRAVIEFLVAEQELLTNVHKQLNKYIYIYIVLILLIKALLVIGLHERPIEAQGRLSCIPTIAVNQTVATC
jgi:hypothetical protein